MTAHRLAYMREYMRRYRAADLERVQANRAAKGLPPLAAPRKGRPPKRRDYHRAYHREYMRRYRGKDSAMTLNQFILLGIFACCINMSIALREGRFGSFALNAFVLLVLL